MVSITRSILTGRGSDSLSESGQCLLHPYTFLSWASQSSTSHNNPHRLEVVQRLCNPNNIKASNRNMLNPKIITYTLSPYSHRPRLPSSPKHNNLTKKSVIPMSITMATNRATSPHRRRRTVFGQGQATLVPSRSISNSSRREAKTNHRHPSTKTCPASNPTTPPPQAGATLLPSPKVTNRRSSRI